MAFSVTSLGTASTTTGGTVVLTTSTLVPAGSTLVIVAGEGGSNTAIGSAAVSAGGTPTLQNSKALGGSNANGWGGVEFANGFWRPRGFYASSIC